MDFGRAVGQAARIEFGLAPMEGVTDFATRLWITQNGAPDFTTTPFLRVTKDYPSKRISANFFPESQLTKAHGVVPCIPQLMASEEEDLIRISRHFLESVPFVDVNCGCPSPTVVGHGAGSSLLRDPQRFADYLRRIVEALGDGRLSVKMRVGFTHEDEFPRLLDVLAELPLARLTLHGRTRADRYRGQARWHWMDMAARRLSYPVFGSGDVVDTSSLKARLERAPTLAGVIVGRGALRNPWVFAELKGSPKIISRAYFAASIVQFVLLQEMQARFWPQLMSSVLDGVFSPGDDASSENSLERLLRQQEELLRRVPELFSEGGARVRNWNVSRASVSRGKMLWNYLRSALNLSPELTVGLLRAANWESFLNALERIQNGLPAERVDLTHHPEWDWVYAGSGTESDAKAERASLSSECGEDHAAE